ncbi:MFS family multidrug efflux protein, similarity to bicyclomycin resistance protein Bcr [hydrothermal vent metagenome]|uniref:MFS family multidrug efflux protein, similarity to bicyclomycin resistance protein Bcr n=1 Tax=hydrothermal vent metagenome TaxID=652676 RepID=A0A3B0T6V7_9ZZZZ
MRKKRAYSPMHRFAVFPAATPGELPMKTDASQPPRRTVMSEREFIVFAAMLTALTALGIDIMLPAMPVIAATFALADTNDRQAIVAVYMLGFAIGHLFFGPLADRFGRVRPLLIALLMVFLTSLAAAQAPEYSWLLVARFVQGLSSAGARVIAIAAIRDRFGGREMARVMSLVMSIFIIVPVVAPGIGGVLVAYGLWKWTFGAVGLMAIGLFVWARARLTETLAPQDQAPLRPGYIARSMLDIATDRLTLGYATAQGLLLAAIIAYLGSAQQIFGELYELGELFPVAFSSMALGLVAASLINSRIVRRLGMRPISRVAGVAFVAVAGGHLLISLGGTPPLLVFAPLLAANLLLFGLIMPNLNALAMEPHGHRAGTAAAFLGFYTTALGAIVGGWIGQLYDGTVQPLLSGYLAIGVFMLVFMWIADSGRGPMAAARLPTDA